jgi:hypothetical protein
VGQKGLPDQGHDACGHGSTKLLWFADTGSVHSVRRQRQYACHCRRLLQRRTSQQWALLLSQQ